MQAVCALLAIAGGWAWTRYIHLYIYSEGLEFWFTYTLVILFNMMEMLAKPDSVFSKILTWQCPDSKTLAVALLRKHACNVNIFVRPISLTCCRGKLTFESLPCIVTTTTTYWLCVQHSSQWHLHILPDRKSCHTLCVLPVHRLCHALNACCSS